MTASTPPGSAQPASTPQSGAVGRLRAALTAALSARDMIAAAAIRSALAAIGNAEAVRPRVKPRPATGTTPAPDGTHRTPVGSEHIAGAAAGLGAAEAARRQLTEADIAEIVLAEIADRRSAADQYDRLGRDDRAERLRREAEVLATVTGVA
jgi:uncharacterized protein YqeY